MSVHRIFLSESAAGGAAPGAHFVIGGDEAHHAIRVKRLAAGDEIELVDGRGMRARARIAETTKHGKSEWKLDAEVIESRIEPRASVRLEVFAAAAKGDRLDEMIESLSQLGVDAFRPLLTDHAIVDPRETKLERLRRNAFESIKQCGRAWPIEISEPVELKHALKEVEGGFACVADARGTSMPEIVERPSRAAVFIGPEGGWSPREFEWFRAGGLRLIRCSPHVLRVETAAIAAATLLINHPVLQRYTPG